MQSKSYSRIQKIWFGMLCFCIGVSFSSFSYAKVIRDQYIIVFKDHVDAADQEALRLSKKHGFALGHAYRFALKGFSAKLTPGLLKKLKADANVAYIEPDLEVKAIAQVLPTGISRIGADLSPVANIDGLDTRVDVDIAILDSGIDMDHPDLNVVGGKSFIKGRGSKTPNDVYGHGTHVAGIAAALDNHFGTVGVAPGARLWALKVLNDIGSGSISGTIKGIDWAIAKKDTIDVLNLSLGGVGRSDSFRAAFQNATAAGLVVVVAAGNESKDIYGSDHVFETNDDTIPAAYPEVASISALSDTDGVAGGLGPAGFGGTELDDTFASFSNYSSTVTSGNPVFSPGAGIDIAAPGIDIYSTLPGGSYGTFSGTSMASPHVAGLAALYIAAFGKPSNAQDVAGVRNALIVTGEDQSLWGSNDPNDPDNNPEALADAEQATKDYIAPPDEPPPPPPSGGTVLVDGGSNSMGCELSQKGRHTTLYISITTVSDNLGGTAVADTHVTLQLLDPNGSTLQGEGFTNSQGDITFRLNKAKSGSYLATVVSAEKTGYTYDTSFTDFDPNTGSVDATHITSCVVP